MYAVESDPAELKQLRQQLSELADSLNHEKLPDDLFTSVGKIFNTLDEYNRRAARRFGAA